MKQLGVHANCAAVLLVAASMAVQPAFAVKSAWAAASEKGQAKGKGQGPERDKSSERPPERPGPAAGHFTERHRTVIRDYYDGQFRAGRCPPGLAKKRNGCMPPGQAKKWHIGRQLPRDVIFYDLPEALIVELGPPPAGHRYVRVASDILLIAAITGMVIETVQDLGRM